MVQAGKINFGMSLALALLLGIAVCFAVEKFDRTLRFPGEIEKKYGIPVLGIIPELELDSGKLDFNSDSQLTEPYRNLRTNLNYSLLISGSLCKSIIVTSALQGEAGSGPKSLFT